jgi:hypothetical protein
MNLPRKSLVTEIADVCNLSCPSCPRGRKDDSGRVAGLMSYDLWLSIVEKARRESSLDCIYLHTWGEPLLNREVSRMATYCQNEGIPCRLSTNLQTTQHVNELLKAAVAEIWISCSGWSQQTYGLTHKGGDFEKMRANLMTLAASKVASGAKTKLVLKWHRYRHNSHEEKHARRFCRERGFTFEPGLACWLPIQDLLAKPRNGVSDLLVVPIEDALHMVGQLKACEKCPERHLIVVGAEGQAKLCCLSYNCSLGEYLDIPLQQLEAQQSRAAVCNLCLSKNLPAYYYRTHPKLLRVAIQNTPSLDVKARLWGEYLLMLATPTRLPIPHWLKAQAALWLRRRL